ncbi:MAG: hypothetical protein HC850_04045 [Rhodomicrobium sp.]|nr:hypothetical protein [Rhodomicrobium sp.]
MDTNIVTNTTIDNSLIMENQDALFTNILNNIDPGDVTIEPADGVALADQVAPTQLQDRIPVPTNYVISAKFKITPAAFVGADVPAEVQERMINVEVTLAWLVPADIANQGGWENFVQAASQGALFVAFKFPNDPKTIVFATNPSQRTVQIGHGFNQPFNLGLVTGAVWGNYRGAVDPDSLPESAPLDPGLELSGRIGVTMTVPAISRLISNALAATVDVASGLITGALLASGAGSPLALAADYIGSILENVVRTGSFGIGASWRGEISTNAEEVTLYGPLGTRAYNREDFARAALTFMAWDMRNFGIPEIAYSKMQWQLEQGSSYFQLSPVTGGWSRITTQGSAIEVVPRRNYGDPGMALINYLNVWGQAVAQDAADPNATSPLTYRDLTPPPAANGLPSRQWVRMYQNIDSGPEAVAVVQHLKQTLSPATWQQFLEGLRPMAEPLGLNLGLSELNPVAPATPELQQARAYLDRDWNKNSNPQETRYIEEIPSDIYNQIRADLGLDLVAGNGTWVIPDYYDPNLPTGDPALEELFPSDFTDITYANLTDDEVQVDAVALTPIDGVVLHTGDGGGKYTGTERNDIMRGAAGIDNLDGGAGDDLVIGTGPEDTLTGGEGNDIAAYLASQTGVTLDLSNLANVVDVEAVGGSDFADTIVTSTARNLPVYGFAGDDIITGSEGAIVYSDFSPEFLERFGASLGLDAENLPGGNDEIDMKNAATGTVLAGGGNDTVYIDMTATVGADGRSVINLPTGLTLDGGEGTDRLVLRVVNPDSGLLVYSIPDLPGNMTNFERVQVGTNIVGVPGISSAPVAHNAPEGWQNARGTPDVISGNGAWPGGGGLEVSNVSGPSPFGGTMGLLVSTPNNGWEETINTTLTGLTVGQTYTTQFAWQQASVLNDPSGLLEGGSVRVRIGDEVREIQPIGTAASDDWQIETISFTATAETMEFEVSSVGNRNGAIVVDTFGPNVALQNTLTSVAENANAERSVKVGDIAVNGDSGNLQLSLAGPDADKFEIVGTELYLKSGVPVDYETQQSLTVSIVADDPATVNIDTQTDFTIAIENIDTLELRNTVTSIRENTPTDASLPVADVVAEPAVGPLVLEGPDAGKFEIVNGQLFLKAGTVLDYEAQQTLNVTVRATMPRIQRRARICRSRSEISMYSMWSTNRTRTPASTKIPTRRAGCSWETSFSTVHRRTSMSR